MQDKKNYVEWLRVISMIAVVFTHIGSTAHTDFSETYYGSYGGVLFQSIVYISHFAVPIFLMISGALLLNPEKEITVEKVLKKYVLRYFWILLIFGWGYAYAELLFDSKRFYLKDVLMSFVNMLQGKSWAHMWYMYMLIGLMLILPLLRAIVKACNDKEKNYLIIVLIVFTSVIPTLTAFTGFSLGISFPISSVYVCYFLLGYVLDNKEIPITKLLVGLSLLCAIILIITAYFNIMNDAEVPFGFYNSPVIMCFSVLIFCIVKEKITITNRFVVFLSNVSFGVYLIDMVWINLAFKVLKVNPILPTPLTGVLIALCSLALSILTTWIMKKLPVLKNLL